MRDKRHVEIKKKFYKKRFILSVNIMEGKIAKKKPRRQA
jgi:hypothetical protein